MTLHRLARTAILTAALAGLAGCGDGGWFGGGQPSTRQAENEAYGISPAANTEEREDAQNTIWELFRTDVDPNVTVEVNKYLWVAAQDVLNFLPIESVDPFTGVIVTGYGAPPGGGRAYRATVYVQDPALDARSLKVALQSRGGGPVSAETQRAVEDAILTRARQLRIQDSNL
jgi:Domain of unknown function (DUF3576)